MTQSAIQRPVDDYVVRIGSVYMLFALYYAQPRSHLVRIYIPLHLMRGLMWMASQSQDVAVIVKKLQRESALVLGAVRWPISGTKEARLAGYPVKLYVPHTYLKLKACQLAKLQPLLSKMSFWDSSHLLSRLSGRALTVTLHPTSIQTTARKNVSEESHRFGLSDWMCKLELLHRLIKPDRLEQQRALSQGFNHLRHSVSSWSSLQHIQLLCNSYAKSQEKLWSGREQDLQVNFKFNNGILRLHIDSA